jgi:hypothetical protein
MGGQTPTTFVVTTKSHYCWTPNIRISTPPEAQLGGTVFPDAKFTILWEM